MKARNGGGMAPQGEAWNLAGIGRRRPGKVEKRSADAWEWIKNICRPL
ncbi:hypothetical protein HMPREF3293_00289 [Christensenella minuta]|uniref:Uncharacterized protein n=1 Tax=Christensenella minuta TaxID=626937 RepID=A0A136Q895_9FIRM|nr:hypothetical protein HMPREF3293_00289 [Christensenella minuta]